MSIPFKTHSGLCHVGFDKKKQKTLANLLVPSSFVCRVRTCIDCTPFSSPLYRIPQIQVVTNNQCRDVGVPVIEERKRSRLWCCTAADYCRKHIVTGTYPVWYTPLPPFLSSSRQNILAFMNSHHKSRRGEERGSARQMHAPTTVLIGNINESRTPQASLYSFSAAQCTMALPIFRKSYMVVVVVVVTHYCCITKWMWMIASMCYVEHK